MINRRVLLLALFALALAAVIVLPGAMRGTYAVQTDEENAAGSVAAGEWTTLSVSVAYSPVPTSPDPVSVTLSCTGTGVTIFSVNPQTISPGTPGYFRIARNPSVSASCSAVEDTVPAGYTADHDCESLALSTPTAGCTITNTLDTGTVNIHVAGGLGTASFGFTTDLPATCTPDNNANFTLDNDGTTSTYADTEACAGIATGVYTVTESSLPPSWTIMDISCTESGGDSVVNTTHTADTATIHLEKGETVDCTFTNEPA